MKKTHTVNIDAFPDDIKPLLKPEMTNDEIAVLGNVLIRHKMANVKNKLLGWYYAKKLKGKSGKDIQK